MNRLFRAGFALLLCVPGFAFAQQSSNQAGAAAPAPANAVVGRIQLDVLVTDKAGNPVEGLTQQDFTLSDNGQARPILS